MVTGKTALLRAQRRWADAHGVRYDAAGCVRQLHDNLRTPLTANVLAEVERGSELEPYATRPARLYGLCSSAALVVNFFGYWRGSDSTPLLRALGVDGASADRLSFEEPLPTGLAGDPPSIDVALRLRDGRLVAVESKFAEWLVPRPRGKRAFKDKYFPPGRAVWADAGLPQCQALADELQNGRERPKYFNAPQLLKHALGLARRARAGDELQREHPRFDPASSVLVYLYYDVPGKESAAHRAEAERARARLASELDLRVATYQAAFAALREQPGDAGFRDYLAYLGRRYFG